ncbi:MAG: sigma-70 family RNA polymerase sigma factor, partial [Acidobacteria bacterium]
MREGFRFLPDTSGDESFHSVYPLVGGVIARACRHSTLSAQDREDFRCFAWIKLIEKDYRRLRQFRGAGSFRTYLARVVTRLLMDFRDQFWYDRAGLHTFEIFGRVMKRAIERRFLRFGFTGHPRPPSKDVARHVPTP